MKKINPDLLMEILIVIFFLYLWALLGLAGWGGYILAGG